MPKWYQQEKTNTLYRQMPKPYDNIFVGKHVRDGFTEEEGKSFDVIINLSDSPNSVFEPARPDQRIYWHPINELGHWGYGVFYWSKHILDYHYQQRHKIYIHCASGTHRAPAIFRWWLVSRGMTIQQAFKIQNDGEYPWHRYKKKDRKRMKDHLLFYDRDMGVLPQHLEKLYKEMKKHPTWGIMGFLRHLDTTPECVAQGYQEKKKKLHRKRKRFR